LDTLLLILSMVLSHVRQTRHFIH